VQVRILPRQQQHVVCCDCRSAGVVAERLEVNRYALCTDNPCVSSLFLFLSYLPAF
jgi:hypothetical protein